MRVKNKLIIIMFIAISVYALLSTIPNNHVLGVTRTTDLNTINSAQYRGVLPFIQELQIAYPKWNFTILNTELDWNAVINAETISNHRRSLTQNTDPAWICPECGYNSYDSGWYGASRQAVEFYMDPRNWLNGKNIFSFEALSYDASIQNIDGVKSILKNTFMDKETITYTDIDGNLQTIYKSYAQIIMEAAQETGVSPYHLASRLRQEQGAGKSALISGTFKYDDLDYTGYYNYFNIGASGDGEITIIKRGLKYAKDSGWANPEISIKGGAKFISSGYIGRGQDTLYLEKYNVNTTNIESAAGHQYMQNISAHISEGLGVYKAYSEIGVLDTNFNFIIPVFQNMPHDICSRPTTSSNLTTENVITIADTLNLREGKSTGTQCLVKLPQNTNLLRIETAKYITNGYYWDKVMYFNNNQVITGYVARDYILQRQDITTTEERYITTAYAILKNAPGINAEPKTILDSNTELTVIDKMTFEIDNMIWYRVKLENGTQGYIASNFIKAVEETAPVSPADDTQTNETTQPSEGDKFKVEGDYLITIPGVKIEQIEGATLNGEVFGTGAKLTLNEKAFDLVMLGDVNGDGKVKATDYILIKNYIMDSGLSTLNANQIKAADVNKDGSVKSTDYVLIKNYIMNGSLINL